MMCVCGEILPVGSSQHGCFEDLVEVVISVVPGCNFEFLQGKPVVPRCNLD